MEATYLYAVKSELYDGETLLWAGQPNSRKHINVADFGMVFLMLFWVGYSVFSFIMITWNNSIINSSILIVAILLISLYLFYHLFGRYILKALRQKRVVYAITSTHVRALLFDRSVRLKTSSYAALKDIKKDMVKIHKDKTGTLIFGDITYYRACTFNRGGMDGIINWVTTTQPKLFKPENEKRDAVPVETEERAVNVVAFFDVDDAQTIYETYRAVKQTVAQEKTK